jgi:uncharacterized protein YggE
MQETNTIQSHTLIAWLQATPLRRNLTILIFVFIALAIVAKTVQIIKQTSHIGKSDQFPQTITVMGKAEEYVKPDTLQFSITVNEEGKDISEATKKTSEKITAAIKILKDNGVEEKNIKTTNYSTQDKYDSVSEPCAYQNIEPSVNIKTISYAPIAPCTNTTSKIVGAIVYQTLEIKIRDIEKNATTEKRSKLIADLATVNIKTDSFVFTVFDLDAVKVRVRGEAIKKAKMDAKVLSKDLGANLRKIAGFNEDNGGYNPYMSARSDMMVLKEVGVDTTPQPQLPTGEQKVVSNVSITYLLK